MASPRAPSRSASRRCGSDRELSALLARPDLRTTIGVRDHAILELLARAGLRRSELARLALSISRSAVGSPLEVVVRGSKRGRTHRHIDVRTTQIYVDVTDQRNADGIAAPERPRHPLAT